MRKWSVAGAALLVLPAISSAQWSITPYAGVYTTGNDLGTRSELAGSQAVKQNTGFVVGGNAHRWFGGRLGFEAGAGYVWSDFNYGEGVSGVWQRFNTSAWLVLTNAKLLMRITPEDSDLRLAFGVGPSVIFAGGDAYSGSEAMKGVKFDRGTNVGGTASLGLEYRLTELIGLRLGGESYMYSVKLTSQDVDPDTFTAYDRKFQTDFVITGGLSFTLPTRSR